MKAIPDFYVDIQNVLNQGKATAITGKVIPITVETICLHGDTPGAAALARSVRQALEAASVQVVPLESLVA